MFYICMDLCYLWLDFGVKILFLKSSKFNDFFFPAWSYLYVHKAFASLKLAIYTLYLYLTSLAVYFGIK